MEMGSAMKIIRAEAYRNAARQMLQNHQLALAKDQAEAHKLQNLLSQATAQLRQAKAKEQKEIYEVEVVKQTHRVQLMAYCMVHGKALK